MSAFAIIAHDKVDRKLINLSWLHLDFFYETIKNYFLNTISHLYEDHVRSWTKKGEVRKIYAQTIIMIENEWVDVETAPS